MQDFLKSILCCCSTHEDDVDDDASTVSDGYTTLLSSVSSRVIFGMRIKRTYGSKKTGVSSSASAMFGGSSNVANQPQPTSSRHRSPLSDITTGIGNLNLTDNSGDNGNPELGKNEPHTGETSKRLGVTAWAENTASEACAPSNDSSESSEDIFPLEDCSKPRPLEPLIQAYLKDRHVHLKVQSWDSIFPPNAIVTKVSEATYAEVYRITTDEGTSIIKIELLQVPTDPLSIGHHQAHMVENVISEVRIMNTLTEVPGFVLFKDAHIVRGIPPKLIIDAFEAYKSNAENVVEFPHPEKHRTESTFLVLELGDAGYSMDKLELKSIHQAWDIFLGVTIALARAETLYEFEHRDLHESNICISHINLSSSGSPNLPSNVPARPRQTKSGNSDIRVTIIDYGLSRMKLPSNEVVFLDLEQDLNIFRGTDGHPQYDVYRRMRTHLLLGTHIHKKSAWHTSASRTQHGGSHTWREHIPYTNVLWIRYILGWLMKQLPATEKAEMAKELKELNRRLDPRTKKVPFESAAEVLEFVVEMGWIGEEELVGEE